VIDLYLASALTFYFLLFKETVLAPMKTQYLEMDLPINGTTNSICITTPYNLSISRVLI